MSERIYSSSA